MGDSTWSTGIDAQTLPNIFQKAYKPVIALKRELSVILPVRLAPAITVSDYYAGTVLAQYNSSAGALSGLFVDYASGVGSGVGQAVCVLVQDCLNQALTSSASAALSRAVFSGYVLVANCINLDSVAQGSASGLNGRLITDTTGVQIFKF